MTVESTNSKQLPQQMGINTEYPFTLDVLLEDPTEEEAKSAIKAKIKLADNTELDLIYNDPGENGYQVVLNSNRLGGKVIVNNKRTILDYITIYRYYQMKQEADYQDFNAAPADTFEQSYDKLTMIDQQQQEVLDRCVKVEMTSNVDPENFTEHVERIYESIDNVDTVSGIKQEVVTTAENIESIINCSENIQSIIDAPQQAQNAAVSANNSLQSENNAEIWAEGTDEEVQALGGEHSSKRWAEMSSGGSWADKDLSNITEAGKDVIRDTAGSGFSLFDVVEKDHILSFEESMGFGLLGTYVYKDAVPGARYGYPDFYNECVAQKEAGTEETITVGDVSFTATKNSNGHIFYDIADKATVDEIFSQRGEAWFYGVDTENERVFLPRGTRSQYTVNTDETGDYVEAGLPNIEGSISHSVISSLNSEGALEITKVTYPYFNITGGQYQGVGSVNLDASNSSPIYGNSDTVQPYATKKLLYIVVGNVKVQSAASDVVDVTTTENDTVPLFTGQYFNFKPNNPSWLKAGEQQDSGGIYTSCYNKLVQALTDNIWEIKVIDSTAMEEGTDYSEYWIVYQDAMRFRTPLRLSAALLANNAGCKGNGITIGLKNGVDYFGLGYSTTAANYNQTNAGLYGTPAGTPLDGQPSSWPYNSSLGLTTDPSKSGIIVDTTLPDDVQLYFKVANAVENLDMLNAGEILEELSNKTDKLQAAAASMPGSKRIELILGQSEQRYQLPADGYLCITKLATAGNQHVYMQNDTNNALDSISIAPIAGWCCCAWCMGKKGDSIYVKYDAGGTLYDFCFVYAEGAQ